MKKAYSTYCLKGVSKKTVQQIPPKVYLERLEPIKGDTFAYLGQVVIYEYFRTNAAHLFCSKRLFNWLSSQSKSVPFSQDSAISFFQACGTCAGEWNRHGYISVHVEGGNSPAGIATLVKDKGATGDPFALLVIAANGANQSMEWGRSKNIGADNAASPVYAFLCGCIHYFECFKNEVLIGGVPPDLKHAPRFSGESSKHLVEHPDIRGDGSPVSPHFRNGHFRLLSSEKFTKKRGQVVFVRECFVKGSAVTVTDDPKPEGVSA